VCVCACACECVREGSRSPSHPTSHPSPSHPPNMPAGSLLHLWQPHAIPSPSHPRPVEVSAWEPKLWRIAPGWSNGRIDGLPGVAVDGSAELGGIGSCPTSSTLLGMVLRSRPLGLPYLGTSQRASLAPAQGPKVPAPAPGTVPTNCDPGGQPSLIAGIHTLPRCKAAFNLVHTDRLGWSGLGRCPHFNLEAIGCPSAPSAQMR